LACVFVCGLGQLFGFALTFKNQTFKSNNQCVASEKGTKTMTKN